MDNVTFKLAGFIIILQQPSIFGDTPWGILIDKGISLAILWYIVQEQKKANAKLQGQLDKLHENYKDVLTTTLESSHKDHDKQLAIIQEQHKQHIDTILRLYTDKPT